MAQAGPRRYGHPPKAPILISFRSRKGTFFDCFTLEGHTDHPVEVVHDPAISADRLSTYIQQQTFNLPYGEPPTGAYDPTQGGLLYIPGVTRREHDNPSAEHQTRMRYEREILEKAMKRGRPVLAVCGGCWQLWGLYGGQFTAVQDHAYSQMPRIGVRGQVVCNVHMHDVNVQGDTFLGRAMAPPRADMAQTRVEVNSVHWKSCATNPVPDRFRVSGVCVQSPNVQKNNRQGLPIRPTPNSIEAFETKGGAPTMGLQYHPEASGFRGQALGAVDSVSHQKVLRFMAQAGDAYSAKQRMLEEYKAHFAPEAQDLELEAALDGLAALRI